MYGAIFVILYQFLRNENTLPDDDASVSWSNDTVSTSMSIRNF